MIDKDLVFGLWDRERARKVLHQYLEWAEKDKSLWEIVEALAFMLHEPESVKERPRPKPVLLGRLSATYCGNWIPVTEALPPENVSILVLLRGDPCPAYGWLNFSAGNMDNPYFVVPQAGSSKYRGLDTLETFEVTHWFSPGTDGLPLRPKHPRDTALWGLSYKGWVRLKEKGPREACFEVGSGVGITLNSLTTSADLIPLLGTAYKMVVLWSIAEQKWLGNLAKPCSFVEGKEDAIILDVRQVWEKTRGPEWDENPLILYPAS